MVPTRDLLQDFHARPVQQRHRDWSPPRVWRLDHSRPVLDLPRQERCPSLPGSEMLYPESGDLYGGAVCGRQGWDGDRAGLFCRGECEGRRWWGVRWRGCAECFGFRSGWAVRPCRRWGSRSGLVGFLRAWYSKYCRSQFKNWNSSTCSSNSELVALRSLGSPNTSTVLTFASSRPWHSALGGEFGFIFSCYSHQKHPLPHSRLAWAIYSCCKSVDLLWPEVVFHRYLTEVQ